MQGRNGGADTDYELADTMGEGESGTNGERSIDVCTLLCVKQSAGEKLLYHQFSSTRKSCSSLVMIQTYVH